MQEHTNLLLATIPMSHDNPNLDFNLSAINTKLEKIAEQTKTTMLPLNLLPRHMYTNHGLHFNSKGKRNTVKMVVTMLESKHKTHIETPPTFIQNLCIEEINVVEADIVS